MNAAVLHQSAAQIANGVRSGRRRAVDVITETLQNIAAFNGQLNALIEVRGEEALANAREIDARVRAGQAVGPLVGVPVVIKDSIWERAHVATAGSRSLLGFRPEQSAIVVDRLTEAGAIVVGRSNLPEFCYRGDCKNDLYGATANPWNIDLTPGGSSGGSAAAVAAGLVPIALGSDGGGSIRIPASFTGIVGFKQTYGLVPKTPGWPGWYDFNHLGPLATTVEDAALMLSVIAGNHPSDPTTQAAPPNWIPQLDTNLDKLCSLKIAFSEDLGFIDVDTNIRGAFRSAISQLRELGLNLTEAHPTLLNPIEIWNTISFADNVESEGYLLKGGLVGENAASLIQAGQRITPDQYSLAKSQLEQYRSAWELFMADYDIIVTPTMECVPFSNALQQPADINGVSVQGEGDNWCLFCYPFNLTGQPALSIPMPNSKSDLPLGLQIVGRKFEDNLVLSLGAAWEHLHMKRVPALQPSTSLGVSDDVFQAFSNALDARANAVTISRNTELYAGQLIVGNDGAIRVRKVMQVDDDCTAVEFERANLA